VPRANPGPILLARVDALVSSGEETMRTSHLIVSVCIVLAACTSVPRSPDARTGPRIEALVPDYSAALDANPNDYIAYLKSWITTAPPELDSRDIVRYTLNAEDDTATAAADRLLSGNEAFCARNGGTILKDPPAFTCAASGGKAIARLSMFVLHATDEQPGTLQFTGESATWMARVTEAKMADYRRVVETLAGNGVAGGVLLSTGENFEVRRFGHLSSADFYALKTPEHGLISFTDLVSVKWSDGAITVQKRDGDRFTESGTALTPGNTIVRLRPTLDNELQAEALSNEQPFRFVYWDAAAKQPRQARVRADSTILQITISSTPSKLRGGQIDARFDKKQREAFRKALVKDARKAAANIGKNVDRVDLKDPKLRSDLDQIGRTGPCTQSQSEDRLLTGDLSFGEYMVCAQYRREAEFIKSNGGELTPDKTPLLFLGRAARAPWYDFQGVMR
jgi:hypothetical protein